MEYKSLPRLMALWLCYLNLEPCFELEVCKQQLDRKLLRSFVQLWCWHDQWKTVFFCEQTQTGALCNHPMYIYIYLWQRLSSSITVFKPPWELVAWLLHRWKQLIQKRTAWQNGKSFIKGCVTSSLSIRTTQKSCLRLIRVTAVSFLASIIELDSILF